jgi:hypothetical protein
VLMCGSPRSVGRLLPQLYLNPQILVNQIY